MHNNKCWKRSTWRYIPCWWKAWSKSLDLPAFGFPMWSIPLLGKLQIIKSRDLIFSPVQQKISLKRQENIFFSWTLLTIQRAVEIRWICLDQISTLSFSLIQFFATWVFAFFISFSGFSESNKLAYFVWFKVAESTAYIQQFCKMCFAWESGM